MMDRIIGSYDEDRKGTLVIALSGIHGNEKAGVQASELLLKMLEFEPITNPHFKFVGKFVGLRGNLAALASNSRFIDVDLNRIWSVTSINDLKKRPSISLRVEEKEMLELDYCIRELIRSYQPERLVILDLHTTSAEGGIFSFIPDTSGNIEIATGMHAPVIKDMQLGISRTTMDYFTKEILGLPVNCIAFEAGQHEDPLAVNMSIAALVSCLRAVGCVDTNDVESRHDEILKDYSKNLPQLAELIYNYSINEHEEFVMKSGFKNFEKIKKDQWLASNNRGKILAKEEGLMLMPRYQKKGTDGFFIIRELEF